MENQHEPEGGFAGLWGLDPDISYLNHGSFGSCPVAILEKQQDYRKMMEREPVRFLVQQVEPMLQHSRESVSDFLGASPQDVVFVSNATAGVNTVFRSLKFREGEEILFTSHVYGACRKALEFISFKTGATLVEARYPFPLYDSWTIVRSVLDQVTPRTRIALIDHITSATALVQPVEILVRELHRKGVEVMIDGAHAPGSIPLNLDQLGAEYYTANCHKWICAPKGAAILHVRKDKQKDIYPLIISHAGHEAGSFTERFYWPGTWDPSACICIGDAIDYLGSLLPGGWNAIMKFNRERCLKYRKFICEMLDIDPPCPDSMIASMASFPLPADPEEFPPGYKGFSTLQQRLFDLYKIEIPVWYWDNPDSRIIRIAVQLYNNSNQYRDFAAALKTLLP